MVVYSTLQTGPNSQSGGFQEGLSSFLYLRPQNTAQQETIQIWLARCE